MKLLACIGGRADPPDRLFIASACQLESLSRCMLISALGSGKARNLLRADRHIQRRLVETGRLAGPIQTVPLTMRFCI